MGQHYGSFFRCTEIIFTRFECVPHKTIAVGRPVIRGRRGNTSIRPTVLVFNGNRFPFMREASVLHTAAIEVFTRIFFQSKDCFPFVIKNRFYFFECHFICDQIDHFQQGSIFIQFQSHFICADRNSVIIFFQRQRRDVFSGVINQDLCFRFGFRITKDSAIDILEHSEDVFPVKIIGYSLIVGEQDFYCCRIDLFHTDNFFILLYFHTYIVGFLYGLHG